MTSIINELNSAALDRPKVGKKTDSSRLFEDSAFHKATTLLLEIMLRTSILSMDNCPFPSHDALLDQTSVANCNISLCHAFNTNTKHQQKYQHLPSSLNPYQRNPLLKAIPNQYNMRT